MTNKKYLFHVFSLMLVVNFGYLKSAQNSNTKVIKENSATTVLYVKSVGSGTQDGSSWENASSDIQQMINMASANTEIWIATGTYKPIRPANNLNVIDIKNRDNAFVMKDNVSLYGGFSGSETSINQRDIIANPTTLSGDFNDDDVTIGSGKTLEILNFMENAHHLIINRGKTTVDGFRIVGGSAIGGISTIQIGSTSINRSYGGGIYNVNGELSLINNVLIGNVAETYGGGIYTANGTTTILNCKINQNLNVMLNGGAIYQQSGNMNMAQTEVLGNHARNFGGGGVYLYAGTANVKNSNISNNAANINGGGIHLFMGNLNILNSSISDNSANSFGGGIMIQPTTGTTAKIINCTLGGNIATSGGGGVFGVAEFHNSIVWKNVSDSPEVSGTNYEPINIFNSIIQERNLVDNGNFDGTNSSLLVFKDQQNGDYSLATGSPLINAGSNALYENAGGNLTIDKDLSGNSRVINNIIDLGAFEFIGEMNISNVNKEKIIIYPNPFTNVVKILEMKDVQSIFVVDASGKIIKELRPKKEIDLSLLKEGLYFINFQMNDGSIKTFKAIKK